jgi:Cu(I)/Ag(I) efflux system protein CusF
MKFALKQSVALSIGIAALISSTPLLAAQQDMSKMPGMNGMKDMPGMHQQAADAEGVGVVKAMDPAKGTVTLQHQAIESIHWPAMTMTFKIAKPEVLQGVKAGDHVRFGLHPEGMNSTVTWIKPADH